MIGLTILVSYSICVTNYYHFGFWGTYDLEAPGFVALNKALMRIRPGSPHPVCADQ